MTVCRYNNITKAAEELYVSQPAISSSIKDLETEFGVKLFYRQNNKLLLTDEGEYFLDKVTDILGAVDILSTQMKDLGNNLNHIKIGVPSMVGTFLFPAMFSAYKEKYPETEVEMQESGSLQVAKSVENNTLDLQSLTRCRRKNSTRCISATRSFASASARGTGWQKGTALISPI